MDWLAGLTQLLPVELLGNSAARETMQTPLSILLHCGEVLDAAAEASWTWQTAFKQPQFSLHHLCWRKVRCQSRWESWPEAPCRLPASQIA